MISFFFNCFLFFLFPFAQIAGGRTFLRRAYFCGLRLKETKYTIVLRVSFSLARKLENDK